MFRLATIFVLSTITSASGFAQDADHAHWRDYLQEEIALLGGWPRDADSTVKIMLQSNLDNMYTEASRDDINRVFQRKTEAMIGQLREYIPNFTAVHADKLRVAAKVDRNRFLRNIRFSSIGYASLKPSLKMNPKEDARVGDYIRDPCGENTAFHKVFQSMTRKTKSGLRVVQ